MTRTTNKLTALKVKNISTSGWYSDGGNLYLRVSPTFTKSWVYRYKVKGKDKRHGLGAYPLISLTVARKKAIQCGLLRDNELDPIAHKRKNKTIKANKNTMTFMKCAETFIDDQKHGWKCKKNEGQWRKTLLKYAYPVIGDLPVNEVTTELVLKILRPMWNTKTETATRVRQRIENILDWAKVMKYREGENPALWRGHLDKLLPKPSKVQKVIHHPAMPFEELPTYFLELRKDKSPIASATAFTILTASRTNEVVQAKWTEINFEKSMWVIPETRMKMSKEHRVPLSPECLDIINDMKKIKQSEFIFAGSITNKPISTSSMIRVLKYTQQNITIHGFRSTFKDWCSETTNFSNNLSEAALAHAVQNKTEAAYRRGDQFEKRRELMTTWGAFCMNNKKPSKLTIMKTG